MKKDFYPASDMEIPVAPNSTPAIHRAEEIADHYRKSTGIQCRVISRSGEGFTSCNICRKNMDENLRRKCLSTHLHSSQQAERFGGSFMYFCPVSLLFWSSPIISSESREGTFIAGPVLMIQREDALTEWEKLFPDLPNEQLKEYLKEIPRIDTSRSRSLAEMLLMCAGWVMDSGDRRLVEGRKVQEQQNRISEYIHELKNREYSDTNPIYPIEKEEELLIEVSRGNRDQAQRILNEILGSIFFSSGRNFQLIKFRIIELIVLLSRASFQGGAEPETVLSSNHTYLEEIDKIRDIEGLSYWLSGILHKFTTLVFDLKGVKHVRQMEKTLQYINTSYMEKISLDEASSRAALSPTYFSRIFKQEMGCSFTTYINRIRVDRAKILLKNTNSTLIEIAGMVGFDDQSYFSKIFKQVTGWAPGKFRESSGAIFQNNQEIHESTNNS